MAGDTAGPDPESSDSAEIDSVLLRKGQSKAWPLSIFEVGDAESGPLSSAAVAASDLRSLFDAYDCIKWGWKQLHKESGHTKCREHAQTRLGKVSV